MQSLLWLFEPPLRKILLSASNKCAIREIRMRINRPVCIVSSSGKYYLCKNGALLRAPDNATMICTDESIRYTLSCACGGSVYACQEQINRGFITVSGGHRIGLCGTAVYNSNEISCVRHISYLNIRVAGQYIGSADKLCEVYDRFGVRSTMIIGPVASGKTTVLRDTARTLSSDLRFDRTVCVIDERGELCGCQNGEPAFDMGAGCDCMNGYRKADGIDIAVRTMSPDVIVFDEFSGRDEIESVIDCFNCGIDIIASIHARDRSDFLRKPCAEFIMESGIFDYFVFLDNCEITQIVLGGTALC